MDGSAKFVSIPASRLLLFHAYSLPPAHMPNTTGNSGTAMGTAMPKAGNRVLGPSLRVVARVRFYE